jgi:hydrogenase expression/formation protein HypD
MLKGILRLVEMVRDRRPGLDNAYRNVVRPEGNPAARAVIDRVFATGDAVWRALGRIPGSGLVLREAYRRFDAGARFGVDAEADYEMPGCRCGSVIQGKIDPPECGLFGKACTPTAPVGPCMVSSEGTCAAWFKYARLAKAKT